MNAPTTMAEYLARFAENQHITGFGLDTGMSLPCPFCAAPNFTSYKIVEVERVLSDGATCLECGRSAKAIIQRDGPNIQTEIVQTGGADQPEWLEPKMRRVQS
jgi:bacterioferritin-associated ferredoxin